MKKIMMVAALAVASLSANAQVYLGGGIGFDTYKEGYDGAKSQSSFKIAPEIGYKLDDQISFGISLGYSSTKNEKALEALNAGDFTKAQQFTIAPYLRYTFARWNNVSFFGEVGFGYTNTKYTKEVERGNTTVSTDTKYNSWNIGVRPGIAVDLTKNFTFLTKIGWLGYKSTKGDWDGAKADSDFGVEVSGENVQFSLLYNF